VAGYASSDAVASAGTMKKILPMVAAASMGTLGKALFGADDTEIPGLLGKLLSTGDEDTSDLDDVISLAKRFF